MAGFVKEKRTLREKMRATGGRPYKQGEQSFCGRYRIAPLFTQRRDTLAPATANFYLWSEKPFVCLMYFRRRENTFAFLSATAIKNLQKGFEGGTGEPLKSFR